MSKLTSRKFWMSIAAFLGSIGMSIAGLVTGEKWVTITGTVCTMLSAAIYAAVEAYCDANCGWGPATETYEGAVIKKTTTTLKDGGKIVEEFTEKTTPETADSSNQE